MKSKMSKDRYEEIQKISKAIIELKLNPMVKSKILIQKLQQKINSLLKDERI